MMFHADFLEVIKKLADLFDFTLVVRFENGKPVDFNIAKGGVVDG